MNNEYISCESRSNHSKKVIFEKLEKILSYFETNQYDSEKFTQNLVITINFLQKTV